MTALARDLNVKGGCARHHRAIGDADFADRHTVPEMQPDRKIGTRLKEHAVIDHRLRAFAEFFGWLKDELHPPGDLILVRREQFGDAERNRRMSVVTAGVHLARVLRGEFGLVLFADRQRIHIGAHQNRRPVKRAFEHSDDTRFAYARLDFQTEIGQFTGDNACRAHFLKTEFGVGVEIMTARDQFVAHRLCFGSKIDTHHNSIL